MDSDELDPAVTVDGVKDTNAPVGSPLALKATDWAEPLVTAVLMVVVVAEPATTLAEVGEAETEKSLVAGAVTVRVKVVAWVAEAVVMDSDELDPAVTLLGVNVATAPVGSPLALRATDWAEPLVTTVLMVVVAAEPATTLAEVGEAETEKSLVAGAVTVRVKVVAWVADVPVPVTVTE